MLYELLVHTPQFNLQAFVDESLLSLHGPSRGEMIEELSQRYKSLGIAHRLSFETTESSQLSERSSVSDREFANLLLFLEFHLEPGRS